MRRKAIPTKGINDANTMAFVDKAASPVSFATLLGIGDIQVLPHWPWKKVKKQNTRKHFPGHAPFWVKPHFPILTTK